MHKSDVLMRNRMVESSFGCLRSDACYGGAPWHRCYTRRIVAGMQQADSRMLRACLHDPVIDITNADRPAGDGGAEGLRKRQRCATFERRIDRTAIDLFRIGWRARR